MNSFGYLWDVEKRFPKRLKHEPLIEAAWTLHFSLREADNLLLLPGHLHVGLQAEFPVVERGPDLPLFAYQALPPLGRPTSASNAG